MCYRRSPQWQARRGCCSGRHAGRACGALEALTLAGLLGALEAGGRLTRSRVEGDSSRELRPFAHDPRASMRSAPCVPVGSVFPFNKVFAETLKRGIKDSFSKFDRFFLGYYFLPEAIFVMSYSKLPQLWMTHNEKSFWRAIEESTPKTHNKQTTHEKTQYKFGSIALPFGSI